MADVGVETARFPILDSVVHMEEEGAGMRRRCHRFTLLEGRRAVYTHRL